MPKILERSVAEVKARADVVEIVADAVTLKHNGASFVGLCPFHEEKTPSFHVRPGKGYKCFGCGVSGDALKFVMEREGLEFVPAVEKLAARYGILLEYEQPKRPAAPADGTPAAAAAPGFALPAGVDEKTARRAIARQARYEAERAKEAKLEEQWIKAHAPAVTRRKLWPWSATVMAQWAAGDMCVASDFNRGVLAQLAAERGWPAAWVWKLAEMDLLAWPELPWGAQRSPAFKVEAPVLAEVADPSRPSGTRVEMQDLRAVGYHQRFMVRDRKQWVYVPYWAAVDRLSPFQEAMIGAEEGRGRDRGEGLVPALPFFMGARSGLRFLVIAEGQWDAVTFAGAMGWMDDEVVMPEGVAVMGSRGSTGVDTLLAYWGDWIRQHAPRVLVLADNDKAGRKWDTPEPTEPGVLPMPTFAQKIEAMGARSVVVSRVKPDLGKDFNDYWRARRPKPGAMAAWLRQLGLMDEAGRWT